MMIGPMAEEATTQRARARTRGNILHSRLVWLIKLANESAEISYPRRLHMPNLNRQLIFMIGMSGTVASKDLATLSGYEKAQISRGVKALAEAGLINHAKGRRSLGLTAAGRAIHLDIMKVARERDTILRRGLSQQEVAHFLEMTGTLIDRACAIFLSDEQTAAAHREDRSQSLRPPEPSVDLARIAVDEQGYRDMIMPWLQSLATYMSRSGTILFRREADLSYLEWHILSQIAENQPLNLSSLIALTLRDKSQVAKMIKQLHAAGLVSRHDEGRINAALTLTEAGQARYDKIFAISVERDRFLFETFRPEDRDFYLRVLDTLAMNAADMLEEERNARSDNTPALKRQRAIPWTAAEEAANTGARHGDDEISALREENALLKKLLAEAVLENALLRDRS
jgi:DNA-binding MarR family transcriptional regulator